jgi:hypothetical protein
MYIFYTHTGQVNNDRAPGVICQKFVHKLLDNHFHTRHCETFDKSVFRARALFCVRPQKSLLPHTCGVVFFGVGTPLF